MAKSCMVATLVTSYGNLGKIHHGQILPGSIDLSEPYGNFGKILVRSLGPNFT